MVKVRRIRVDEAPLVRELVRTATEERARLHPEDRIGISEQGLVNLETQFRLGAVHEDELTLVAVDDDKIVGFLCAWITRGRATPGVAGEIDWLWVTPDTPGAMSSGASARPPSAGSRSRVPERSSRWRTASIPTWSCGGASVSRAM